MAPPASLVLLVFSLLVALTATAAAADEEAGQNCSPVSCGGVNITYPFAIVPGEAIETSCGAIGFQVRCENDTPYLGYKNSLYGHQFQILHISYDNASLVIADVHKLHHFNGSDANSCHAPSNNSSNKLGLPFSISPMNKNLIFYNCEKPLPETVRRSEGLAETTCGNRTFVRVAAERSDDSSGSYSNYFLEGCEATVVPALARSGGAVNASNYKELISGGFLLTWQAPSPSPPMKSVRRVLAMCSDGSELRLPGFGGVVTDTDSGSRRGRGWAPANVQGGDCSATACGSLTILDPFGIVPEYATATNCGQFGFQVSCQNGIPYLGYYRRGNESYNLRILDIFYGNGSLLVADVRKLADLKSLNHKDCQQYKLPTANTSSKIALPFSISALNQELFLYNCAKPPAPETVAAEVLAERRCGNDTFVARVGGSYGELMMGNANAYVLEGCDAIVVPMMLVGSGKPDASNYEELVSNGFLLTWQMQAGGNDKGKIVRIVCGVGAGGLLAAACVGCFVWRKRKRRKQVGAPNGFMRSESSMQSYSKDLELGGSPHIFTYEELEEATDGFSDSRELGDGGFGTVYKGKLRDGRVVAVKRLYKNNYKRVEQFINEVDILSRLLHQNLVILYGCTSRSSRDLMLVYEYIPNGTVADHLHGPRASERGLTWPVRMNIAIETAGALAYLHAVEIIHRDVKTNNILLDNNFHVKVADFGLSRLYPLEVTHVSTVPQGTPGYVDPVYHQCYKLTDKSDVYSFGVVLVELISSKPAVDMGRSHSEINLANMALNRIQNHEVEQLVDPELGYETDDETKRTIDLVAELAFQCLQLERELRPSIKEVVEALNCIKNGDSPEKRMDLKSSPKEDSHLLTNSVQFSPDSVIHRFHSQSTTHSVASNTSG